MTTVRRQLKPSEMRLRSRADEGQSQIMARLPGWLSASGLDALVAIVEPRAPDSTLEYRI